MDEYRRVFKTDLDLTIAESLQTPPESNGDVLKHETGLAIATGLINVGDSVATLLEVPLPDTLHRTIEVDYKTDRYPYGVLVTGGTGTLDER